MQDGLLSGKKCKNSLLVPFIQGTEPKSVPNVRRKCATRSLGTNKGVLSKLRAVFEEGES